MNKSFEYVGRLPPGVSAGVSKFQYKGGAKFSAKYNTEVADGYGHAFARQNNIRMGKDGSESAGKLIHGYFKEGSFIMGQIFGFSSKIDSVICIEEGDFKRR
jgi:hypothetical protein